MAHESTSHWPARPYKGFGNYGPDDVALFAGRDREITAFARMVADPKARLLLLHGATGCGKSSFLRAGVIPFLEGRLAGFTFLKDPARPTIARGSKNAKAFFIRSTEDPLGRLAAEVFRVADQGFDVVSPSGPKRITLDDAKLGCASAEAFAARVSQRPVDLIKSLEALASALPVKLVFVVDQAEEVVTQNRRRPGDRYAERFFEFLAAFASTRWPLNLIVSLRTEFFGAFQARLRRLSKRRVDVHDYFLDELPPDRILEAMMRPTLDAPVRKFGAPRHFYKFSFDDGLPEQIVKDLTDAADAGGLVSGILPFLQVVCESLYTKTKFRNGQGVPWVIARDDYRACNPLEMLASYVDDILGKAVGSDPDGVNVARTRWKEVLASLAKVQVDGSITTDIKRIDELRAIADKAKASDFERVMTYLAHDDQGVLRRDRIQRAPPLEPAESCSLRHDVIGLVLNAWRINKASDSHELVSKREIEKLMPSVETIDLTCTFDELGSGESFRRWLDVRSQQVFVDYRIPYGFGVESPHGRVIVDADALVRPVEEPTRSALPVRFVQGTVEPQTVKGDIEICGSLSPDTAFVGFEIRQPFERAFCTSRIEVEQAYKNDEWTTEYTGVLVQLPTGRLHLTVRFPRSFCAPGLEAGPVVFFGSGEKTHDAEIARIRPNFKLEDTVATLEVFQPQQGLQYAIYWMPPGADLARTG
jgi:hypothetical protein